MHAVKILFGAFALLTASALQAEAEFFTSNPDSPYSEAVKVGNLLFLAGQLGINRDNGELAPGGIQGETRQALENIKAIVEKNGGSMDQVPKCTVFLADIAEWASMNEVYVTYFPTNKPARSAVGNSGLGPDARVEIECIAALPN